ncbi:MAG TPA: hypothetical protein VG733_07685, partial [Chthoniobacteraceae bacterium]|nr:hypothetical protein [Chthoniobacteraceae bacterium]
MEIAERPIKPEAEFTKEAIIPFCVLAGIIVIDHFFLPGATITPVCNFLAMGILALYLHPRWMVFWAICFTCSSLYMLTNSGFCHPGPPD